MATINTYDLNYTDAFKLGIKNYANFNGRASRSEYWRFVAAITMIQGSLGLLAMICNALGLPNFESIVGKVGFCSLNFRPRCLMKFVGYGRIKTGYDERGHHYEKIV